MYWLSASEGRPCSVCRPSPPRSRGELVGPQALLLLVPSGLAVLSQDLVEEGPCRGELVVSLTEQAGSDLIAAGGLRCCGH